LSRCVFSCSFCAWSPEDRDRPEHRIPILPGAKHLFTDEKEPSGVFIKFLKGGSWYEAVRDEFVQSTVRLRDHQDKAAISARRGA
jgi:hypothetical protein